MLNVIYKGLSEKILGLAFKVHNKLGPELLEVLYEEAFSIELRKENIPFARQKEFPVYYDNEVIGNYKIDIIHYIDIQFRKI